jgi:hypothetical protein
LFGEKWRNFRLVGGAGAHLINSLKQIDRTLIYESNTLYSKFLFAISKSTLRRIFLIYIESWERKGNLEERRKMYWHMAMSLQVTHFITISFVLFYVGVWRGEGEWHVVSITNGMNNFNSWVSEKFLGREWMFWNLNFIQILSCYTLHG